MKSSSTIILLTVAVLLILTYLLWNQSAPVSPSRASKARGAENTSRTVAKPHRNIILTPVVHDASPKKPSQLQEERNRQSEKIDDNQINLVARDHEQYLALLEYLHRQGITPRRTIDRLNSVSAILPPDVLARLLELFPELSSENDSPIWIPENSIGTWNGTLRNPFGGNLLPWLGVDSARDNRGSGVTVAILDTPVTKTFTTQDANINQIDLFGYVQPDTAPGHGNAVSSLLVGQAREVTGIAPSVNLLSIPVLDSNGEGSAFDLACGIVTAVDTGADIISMSLGSYSSNALLSSAVNYAKEHGVVLVAASGNDGTDQVLYPAACDGVIAVGAVDASGTIAGFSNTGEQVDIAAPGVGINSAWADEYDLVSFSGTSAAVPCVVGILANLMGDDTTLSAEDAASQLLSHTLDNGAPGPDHTYGNGIIDYQRTTDANTPGIIDAAAAGHFLDMEHATNTTVPLVVSAQNTGTETLPTLTLHATLDGTTTTLNFSNVAPGEVVSTILTIDTTKLENATSTITTQVSTPSDARPGNETKTSIISLK